MRFNSRLLYALTVTLQTLLAQSEALDAQRPRSRLVRRNSNAPSPPADLAAANQENSRNAPIESLADQEDDYAYTVEERPRGRRRDQLRNREESGFWDQLRRYLRMRDDDEGGYERDENELMRRVREQLGEEDNEEFEELDQDEILRRIDEDLAADAENDDIPEPDAGLNEDLGLPNQQPDSPPQDNIRQRRPGPGRRPPRRRQRSSERSLWEQIERDFETDNTWEYEQRERRRMRQNQRVDNRVNQRQPYYEDDYGYSSASGSEFNLWERLRQDFESSDAAERRRSRRRARMPRQNQRRPPGPPPGPPPPPPHQSRPPPQARRRQRRPPPPPPPPDYYMSEEDEYYDDFEGDMDMDYGYGYERPPPQRRYPAQGRRPTQRYSDDEDFFGQIRRRITNEGENGYRSGSDSGGEFEFFDRFSDGNRNQRTEPRPNPPRQYQRQRPRQARKQQPDVEESVPERPSPPPRPATPPPAAEPPVPPAPPRRPPNARQRRPPPSGRRRAPRRSPNQRQRQQRNPEGPTMSNWYDNEGDNTIQFNDELSHEDDIELNNQLGGNELGDIDAFGSEVEDVDAEFYASDEYSEDEEEGGYWAQALNIFAASRSGAGQAKQSAPAVNSTRFSNSTVLINGHNSTVLQKRSEEVPDAPQVSVAFKELLTGIEDEDEEDCEDEIQHANPTEEPEISVAAANEIEEQAQRPRIKLGFGARFRDDVEDEDEDAYEDDNAEYDGYEGDMYEDDGMYEEEEYQDEYEEEYEEEFDDEEEEEYEPRRVRIWNRLRSGFRNADDEPIMPPPPPFLASTILPTTNIIATRTFQPPIMTATVSVGPLEPTGVINPPPNLPPFNNGAESGDESDEERPAWWSRLRQSLQRDNSREENAENGENNDEALELEEDLDDDDGIVEEEGPAEDPVEVPIEEPISQPGQEIEEEERLPIHRGHVPEQRHVINGTSPTFWFMK